MSDIQTLLPTLPQWLSAPLILLSVSVALWPGLSQAVIDLTAKNRHQKQERSQLELLKLRYEIELYRKQNDLERLPEDTHLLVNSKENKEKSAIEEDGFVVTLLMPSQIRLFYCMIGGLISGLIDFLLNLSRLQHNYPELLNHQSAGFLLGLLLRYLLLVSIGGTMSFLFVPLRITKLNAITLGMSYGLCVFYFANFILFPEN
ncbi:hypothetical protein ACMDCR_25750 [Labrys okinawensis]|uniref:hypothetical protein n=1 Tax=Labrys okinawensis TaxID=346911 RepID=UPI0039BCA43F